MDVKRLEVATEGRRRVVNRRYRLVRTIGQGQFGKVLLSEDLAEGGLVAIKTINRVDRKKLITRTYLSHSTKIKREIQIMKECSHPNVVRLFLVIDDMRYDKILLVLEYCKLGELDWKRYNHYHEKYLKTAALPLNSILRDVANGLEYLHLKNIIHRDLKPSNLLISAERRIKISDFGVSLILENNANDDRELGKTMGTPAFFAPELCQFVNNRLLQIGDLARSKIDARIDVWLLGVVLYCLFFHVLPFDGANEFALFKSIVTAPLKFPATRNSTHVRCEDVEEVGLLQDLVGQLLAKDPARRPTLAQVRQHRFTVFDLSRSDAAAYARSNARYMKLRRHVWLPPADEAPPLHDMERVDDLLDSYLDDSDESDTDTTNVLAGLGGLGIGDDAQADRVLDAELRHEPLSLAARRQAPEPVVTIGRSSPSSLGLMFSPTQRFFARLQHKEPTIHALAGEPEHELEPPLFFRAERRLSGELVSSEGSRKNSILSAKSGLFRLPSSSSSLNLHAYLTDDDHETTLTMDQYLDSLG